MSWRRSSGFRASSTAANFPTRPRLGRRAFLGALGGGAAALLVPQRRQLEELLPFGEETSSAAAAVPFQAPLPIPRELTAARLRIPIREAEAQIFPGAKTKLWTYGGTFPGPTVRRPAGERTEVSFVHELPAAVGELSVHLHGGHNRTQFDGQPGGLTNSQPQLLLLPDPTRPLAAGVGQRPAARSRAAENLRLRPDGGRPPRTLSLPVVPRPPTRPDLAAQLARAGRDVDRRRRVRRLAAAAARRARHPADDRRADLRSRQPADRSVHRAAGRRPTGSSATASSSTAPSCPTTGSAPAATACGSSTSRPFAATTCGFPTAPRWSRSRPTAA